MKLIIILLCLLMASAFLVPNSLKAEGLKADCDNRFAVLVNPVRSRNLWLDKSTDPLIKQYDLIGQHNLAATWLLQYDLLKDQDILKTIRQFDNLQELGVFLEVSEGFAQDSRVIYPHAVPWFSPQAVFLSGYTQSDRRKLIDTLFDKFKITFGHYPKSVGAWWIDSYSLNYLKDKYGISSAMIVADQKTTDSYGVWGQWWGVPYYPSKANIMTPASNNSNKLDVVIIQWAQRDPLLSFGDGPKFSNYSLQANDYIDRGKDTEFFNKLTDQYLDCSNPIGQITVGLETGMESVGFLGEYKNQLDSLVKRKNLVFVTMRDFARSYAAIFPDFPKTSKIGSGSSIWDMSTGKRFNGFFDETIYYNPEISFADYFIADKTGFLNRHLPGKPIQQNMFYFPWYIILVFVLLVFSFKKSLLNIWAASILFAFASFGLVFKSFYQNGWKVYFGPQLNYLEFYQAFLILIIFITFWLMSKVKFFKDKLWMFPIIFGFDFLLQAFRFSHFTDRYYLGFALDVLKFIGVSFSGIYDFQFVYQDFPNFISAAFLRFDYNYLWQNPTIFLTVYPMLHILAGSLLGEVLVKLPKVVQKAIIGVLLALFILHIISIVRADPRVALPILLQ